MPPRNNERLALDVMFLGFSAALYVLTRSRRPWDPKVLDGECRPVDDDAPAPELRLLEAPK